MCAETYLNQADITAIGEGKRMVYVRSNNRAPRVGMSTTGELRAARRFGTSRWRSLAVGLAVLCGLSPATTWAQSAGVGATPPQEAVADVIFPVGLGGAGLCPEVGRITSPTARETDFSTRCTELVVDSLPGNNGDLNEVHAGLQAMAPEEVATQGTLLVETSNTQFSNISARLAALRAGTGGLGLGQFALLVDRYTTPLTLVASTEPMAAVEKAAVAAGDGFSRFGVFATGSLSLGDRDATDRESGFDFNAYGITAGADYRLTSNFILGLALGLSSTDIDLDNDGGSLDAFSFTGSLYATYYASQQFFIDAIASIGWSDYDIDRAIRYTIREADTTRMVAVDKVASADTDGLWVGFSLGGGYDFTMGALTVGPLARFNYRWATIDGYEEEIDGTGAGIGLALDIDDQDIESLSSVLGAQASYAISMPWGVILPQLRLEWEHEFLNDSETIKAHFVHDPTPDDATEIRLATDDPDRDFFNVAAGVVAAFRQGISAFVQYETILGLDDITVHHVALGLRAEF